MTQRPARIDKNVLSQCHTQIILKLTNPNDLKTIVSSVEGLDPSSAREIQRLPIGVGMVVGGGITLPIMVHIRVRQSQHGGASVDIIHDDNEGNDDRYMWGSGSHQIEYDDPLDSWEP